LQLGKEILRRFGSNFQAKVTNARGISAKILCPFSGIRRSARLAAARRLAPFFQEGNSENPLRFPCPGRGPAHNFRLPFLLNMPVARQEKIGAFAVFT
jgi:hypothetical protein